MGRGRTPLGGTGADATEARRESKHSESEHHSMQHSDTSVGTLPVLSWQWLSSSCVHCALNGRRSRLPSEWERRGGLLPLFPGLACTTAVARSCLCPVCLAAVQHAVRPLLLSAKPDPPPD